jgi:hypothetical protein
MTIYPATLDLRETDQNKDYNLADIQHSSCITIDVTPPLAICLWIESNGGASAFPGHSALILALINGYLEGISSLGFIVTSSHILGCINYYLGDTAGGNGFTNCNY